MTRTKYQQFSKKNKKWLKIDSWKGSRYHNWVRVLIWKIKRQHIKSNSISTMKTTNSKISNNNTTQRTSHQKNSSLYTRYYKTSNHHQQKRQNSKRWKSRNRNIILLLNPQVIIMIINLFLDSKQSMERIKKDKIISFFSSICKTLKLKSLKS